MAALHDWSHGKKSGRPSVTLASSASSLSSLSSQQNSATSTSTNTTSSTAAYLNSTRCARSSGLAVPLPTTITTIRVHDDDRHYAGQSPHIMDRRHHHHHRHGRRTTSISTVHTVETTVTEDEDLGRRKWPIFVTVANLSKSTRRTHSGLTIPPPTTITTIHEHSVDDSEERHSRQSSHIDHDGGRRITSASQFPTDETTLTRGESEGRCPWPIFVTCMMCQLLLVIIALSTILTIVTTVALAGRSHYNSTNVTGTPTPGPTLSPTNKTYRHH